MPSIVKLPTKAPFQKLPEQFPGKRVLVVGDLVADHYIYGQTDRVSREAPVLIVRYESSEVKLGGAANAAANVRSLGGQVTALGVVGRDEMGETLRALFRDAGIKLQSPQAVDVPTATKTRILAGGVNTTRQQMLRLDRGPEAGFTGKLAAELARLVTKAAQSADAVLVSDYGGGVLREETRAALARLAREGLPVCVDSRYALCEYRDFTVVKPNVPELEALVGMPVRTEGDLLRAGLQAVRDLRCQSLVVTRGRHGMALFDSDGNAELLPVWGNEQAVDVTGAGDTVGAALALCLAAGARVAEAARVANVAGGLVVQKQGTATVSSEELSTALGTKPR